MKKVLILCVLFGSLGCRDKVVEVKIPDQTEALAQQIQVDTNRKVTLMPKARKTVGKWLAYATAKNQIDALKTATGAEIMQVSQPLVQIMQALKNTMPDSLQVPAVNARVNVLLTKAHVLHQRAIKQHQKADEIFETAQNIIVEFDNFKIQLNELFLKAPGDFEIELDSIFAAKSNPDSLIVEDSLLVAPVDE